ncbi:hypothetical protein MTP99_015978 [Tenebrio molitor]|nr:hypothetical protein MTP99_015978 [Tenebrio molitor]
MASFRDLQMDWSTLCQDCTDCWTNEGKRICPLSVLSERTNTVLATVFLIRKLHNCGVCPSRTSFIVHLLIDLRQNVSLLND